MKIKRTSNFFETSSFFWSILIFSFASFFRIFFLDLIEFKFDEAFTVFELNNFFSNPYLMQQGPIQSTGVYNYPFYNYLMIILSLPSRNPVFLSFLIALINSFSIVLLYLLIKRFYGNFIAVFSSLILAFSPWSILLSRKIWIPDLILPFVIFSFYYFHKLIIKSDRKSSFLLFFSLSLLFQLHATGIFFTIAVILILFLFKKTFYFKNALLGFGTGFIFAIPYFLKQLFSNPFCIDCLSFFSYQSTPRPFDIYNFLRPFQLLGGLNFNTVIGNDYILFINFFPFLDITNYIFIIEALFILLGIYYILKFKKEYIYLVLFLLFIPFFYFISKTPSYTQYFASLIPISALILAFSFKYLFSFKHLFLKILAIIIFVIFIATNIFFEYSFYNFLKQKKTVDGDYGSIFSVNEILVTNSTSPYIFSPYYNELKNYSYMFTDKKIIHGRIGYFLMQKGNINHAVDEFNKSLKFNNKDVFARTNLTYIYILNNEFELAEKELKILEKQDTTTSAVLKNILNQNKLDQTKINN
jgi:4-amino-4-deoxy-L-arabinose transferase-like glycosyltransferase